jgi:succinate dehydrogenase / fumarate reductase, cytochrome b subunit
MNKKYLTSSVFKKFVMGASGLALVGFVITHLLGNLLLYKTEGNTFNEYAHKLESLGGLLVVAEMGLLVFFLVHAFSGVRLALSARTAKPIKYAVTKSKGGESKMGLSSNNMVWSGTFLFLFVVLHVAHFKFGPNIAEGYVASLSSGGEARDLHRHVVEQFQNPIVMIAYVVAMIFLGLHLRHGIWSALQSLGLTRENNSKAMYCIGGGLAILLSVGFLFIPLVIYFRG